MHRALSARWLNRALRLGEAYPSKGVALFLCPTLTVSRAPTCARPAATNQRRRNHVQIEEKAPKETIGIETEATIRKLPITCSGCGSFTQTSNPNEFGYFNTDSRRVRGWIKARKTSSNTSELDENKVVEAALKALDAAKLKELGLSHESLTADHGGAAELQKPPVCDRCHDLTHHNLSTSSTKIAMHHPTVESLRETIEESPHKYNHIYHVVDAADFPMSLIPRLNVLLGDIALRTRNRRSRAGKYMSDRQTEMSFIITRSDLLGPTKEKVDKLMPIIREILRDALGRVGNRVRLGNVRCVSALRGWWTKEVRDDIWNRGGAGWMVGKVNVGKSQLFEAVYPKGRMKKASASAPRGGDAIESADAISRYGELDMGDLLPPAQPATNYPEMPVVSSHPGTTASPIRIPYGDGKGELIDLPGLARGDLELFVNEKDRKSLIMKKRVVPEQISLMQGASLLLGGGLIRITPRNDDLVFLAYNFTPLEEHRTSTEKAEEYQSQQRQSSAVRNISIPGAGESMKHAGTFELRYDVTKRRAGPLTNKNLRGLQVESLPFRVLATDILIEGVGYVELVAQVRARALERSRRPRSEEALHSATENGDSGQDPFAEMMSKRKGSEEPAKLSKSRERDVEPEPKEPQWPSVDVFSPEGRFIGSRQPLGGWLSNKPLVKAVHRRSRPRKSMKGQKKMAKVERRAKQALAGTHQ